MKVRYSLDLQDHFAWYDYYCTTSYGRREKSKLPLIGEYLNRKRRERFGNAISATNNRNALGERTLELNVEGVWEFSANYDFTSAWSDVAFVAATNTHLFIAHVSMSSHIVPLSAFSDVSARTEFIRRAEMRGSPPTNAPTGRQDT